MAMKMALGTSVSLLLLLAYVAEAGVFDITKYGAKSDGQTDISQAFMSAWKEACAAESSSTIVIPAGAYLLNQVSFAGPCKAPIEIQLAGTLKAPADPSQFKTDGWVSFSNIDQFTLHGGGVFDGQGATAWSKNQCAKTGKCSTLPANIRFNFIKNGIISDVTTKDSKLFHVNVLGCTNVTFSHFTVTAPENSLNTDGIHIGRSTGINIFDSDIKTGDDCISIGDGAKQVTIERVTCGPGHGISVGSLGKYPNEEEVAGIFVRNCTLTNTMNGVRVKTWPNSYAGTVTDLHFEDIIMNSVGNPVFIDQEYCPWNQCTLQVPSKVKLSNISFKGIRGTSSTQLAVKLNCSKGFPCQNVEVGDIDLKYNGAHGPATSQCANVQPTLSGQHNPPVCT